MHINNNFFIHLRKKFEGTYFDTVIKAHNKELLHRWQAIKNTCTFCFSDQIWNFFYYGHLVALLRYEMIHNDGNNYKAQSHTHTLNQHARLQLWQWYVLASCCRTQACIPECVCVCVCVCVYVCVFVSVQRIDPAIASTRALRDMRRVERGGMDEQSEREQQ